MGSMLNFFVESRVSELQFVSSLLVLSSFGSNRSVISAQLVPVTVDLTMCCGCEHLKRREGC